MTCIVGLVEQGTVYMGGDSAGIAGWDLTLRADPKVFRKGSLLIGFTTSFRMGQLLRYEWAVPEPSCEMDGVEYLVRGVIPSIRQCFKDGGFAKKEQEQESGGFFLVGYQGALYRIESDYEVSCSVYPFDAVGCGAQVALGVLYVSTNQSPRVRLQLALSAAERFNAGVRGPFVIERLGA